MNRLKLWLFALVVVAAGAASVYVHSRTLREDALASIDVRIASASAHVAASARALSRDVSALAALAARDPALAGALAERAGPAPVVYRGRRSRLPPVAPVANPAVDDAAAQAAADAALEGAGRVLGSGLPEGARILAANRRSVARLDAATAGEALPLLTAALDGTAARGHVRAAGTIFFAAAAPAGEGAAVVVLVPVDVAHARALAAVTGTSVAFVAPEVQVAGTATQAEIPELVKGAFAAVPGVTTSLGRLGNVDLGSALHGLQLPKGARFDAKGPLLFGAAPAQRLRTIPLEGLKGALVVVAAPTAPLLAPIAALQWEVLGALAVLVVLALLFSLLVRTAEPAPMVPETLLAAAAKIESGDFSARSPQLAGKLGTIAAALNRAAEAASTPPTAKPAAAPAEDLFASALRPPEADPSTFEFPSHASSRAIAAAPEPAFAAPGADAQLVGGAFEATPVPSRPAAPPLAPAPELLQAAARAAPPPALATGEDEQAHWQQVFQDFLRTRTECGEAAEGLTFERFRQKLATNKANLVAKYACRTVRFQVYVKEGKAALKATPVK